MPIYLDNSATTRPCEEVIQAMTSCMREGFFNPSALYAPALQAQMAMRDCRSLLLSAVHAPEGSRVIFTSGGTEADNLAVLGLCGGRKDDVGVILYSAGEHAAIREACRKAGAEALAIPYTQEGFVDLAAFESMLSDKVRLVCCMQINNETGAIQPLREISALMKKLSPAARLHVDGVQGFLRVPFDMNALKADTYALSGHKIRACKGIGALICTPDCKPRAQLLGGGQENAYRSGTENTPGIAGLAAAVRAWPKDCDIRKVKLRLWECIRDLLPDARVNGPDPENENAAPHILNVSFPPVRSETMLHALEGDGIYVGIGSACSSHKQKVSGVLKAMNVPPKYAETALRFSLTPENTAEEMEITAQALKKHYDLLSKYTRR